jgi:hypothetical protein
MLRQFGELSGGYWHGVVLIGVVAPIYADVGQRASTSGKSLENASLQVYIYIHARASHYDQDNSQRPSLVTAHRRIHRRKAV